MKLFRSAIVVLWAALWLGCQDKSHEPAAAKTPEATNRFYVVRGVVKSLDPEAKTVTVDHEKIPNYMDAMTMPFRVKDAKQLEGLQPGDTIWFMLLVTPNESWIDKVTKEKKPAASAPPPAGPPEREAFRVARDVEPLKVGDLMTDYRFTNELGQAVNLSDFKGSALAFTFIFTRCPLPDFCPRMSRNFSEVSQKLGLLSNGPTNWHLLTISFDPHFDTPEVLRGYAQAFQNDPKRWNFVTGAMIDIDAITDQFELTIDKNGNQWNHKERTVIVDANGRVQKIIFGNEWKPDALVDDMVKAAKPIPEKQARN
jgi:protein SCO1